MTCLNTEENVEQSQVESLYTFGRSRKRVGAASSSVALEERCIFDDSREAGFCLTHMTLNAERDLLGVMTVARAKPNFTSRYHGPWPCLLITLILD